MAKRAAAKESATPANPPSGSTYRTKQDGTLMRKKTFWIEDELVHAFEVWCVQNRREPNEVLAEIFRSILAKKA